MYKHVDVSVLKGLTLVSILGMEQQSDDITFKTECGRKFIMYHQQDCCENVYVEDVIGDVEDLLGATILDVEERTSEENPVGVNSPDWQESFTWTFYHFTTIRGTVVLRWYGGSNGYYSEKVDLAEIV